MIDNSQRTAAKIAGVTGLLAFAIVVFGNYVLLNPLVVPARCRRNSAEHHGAPNASSDRAYLLFAYSASVVVLLTALYVILKPSQSRPCIDRSAVPARIRGVVAFCDRSICLAALRLLGNANLLTSISNRTDLQALAGCSSRANFDDYYVGLPFFGLAATVCAWLWLKSSYIPRGLSIFGVISSAWCVLCAFIFLIFPHFNKIVNDYIFDSPMALFELAVSFWLLFKGIGPSTRSKPNRVGSRSSTSASSRLPMFL